MPVWYAVTVDLITCTWISQIFFKADTKRMHLLPLLLENPNHYYNLCQKPYCHRVRKTRRPNLRVNALMILCIYCNQEPVITLCANV